MCVAYPYYNPARDIPSLAGKVILITGGTSGTGKEAAAEISRYGRPAQVWIAGRRAEEGGRAIAHIRKWCGATPPRSVTSEPEPAQHLEDMYPTSGSRQRGGTASHVRWESDYSSNQSSAGTPSSSAASITPATSSSAASITPATSSSAASITPATSSSASSRSRGSSIGDDGEAAAAAASATTTVRFLYMDLASLESVRDAAARFLASVDRLDVLILGASEIAMPPGVTVEGYERHMGVNHLGHALLLKLLMRLLVRTATCDAVGSDVRVVSVSSMAHRFTTSKGIDFDTLKPGQHAPHQDVSSPTRPSSAASPSRSAGHHHHHHHYAGDPYPSPSPSRLTADDEDEDDGRTTSALLLYGQSKLANILYARELAERCPLFTTVSINPGISKTEADGYIGDGRPAAQRARSGSPLMDRIRRVILPFFGLDMCEAIKNHLWAATAKGVESGEYYEPVGVPSRGTTFAHDRILGWRLWEWTQRELEGHSLPENLGAG
ncbi:hypothetical protein RB595_004336 [Gaeumannomyces hyphopodioides]